MTDSREFTLPAGDRTRALQLAVRILGALPVTKAWKVRCVLLRNERSTEQNGYLWAVPYELLAKHTGFEKEELHQWACGAFFGWRDKKIPKTPRNKDGYTSVPVRTTTRDENDNRDVLDWKRFSDFVEFLQRFAAERLGVLIPDPDKEWREREERKAA